MVNYCSDCNKEFTSKIEDGLVYHCPFCGNKKFLYHLDEQDTNILRGKTIKKIYNNKWEDHSRLIVFDDDTKGIADMKADFLEIKLLGHDYEQYLENDFLEDIERDDTPEEIKILLKKRVEVRIK